MSDLAERNSLFAHGIALGLDWTSGETADEVPTIHLPSRDPAAIRASLTPAMHLWMLGFTTPLHGSGTITVDKLNRDADTVLRGLAVALRDVVDRVIDTEPASALGIIGFLGSLGIAIEDDDALRAATAGRVRADALLGSLPG